ncbi:hypothetical protein GZL_01111 [Streptomyces sp. 769]|nr:hypothetical protein GZL_01111 [Streptomyces sp. 769]
MTRPAAVCFWMPSYVCVPGDGAIRRSGDGDAYVDDRRSDAGARRAGQRSAQRIRGERGPRGPRPRPPQHLLARCRS